ncbi:voltage-dependent anion channel-domain-containing protein [Russula vinacea]|nr:voltage-dependent anion channel-domain-containing protein [Russula vinacea]
MSEKKGITDSIRHFPPAWFAVNMGTGAVSTLFALFPYGLRPSTCRALSTAVFFLNLFLFILFFSVSITRYIRDPNIWRIMIRHPVQSLYLSTFPMGAVTLIGVGTTVLHDQYGFGGRTFLFTLWGLWWVDIAVSFLCCWGLFYVMPSIVSSFIPLGPFGQAGFAVLTIGKFMKEALPVAGSTSPFLAVRMQAKLFLRYAFASVSSSGDCDDVARVCGVGIQYILRRTRVSFGLSFWGMIFPNGVYAILTVALYQVLDVAFFRVWGQFIRCVGPNGKIFEAPCLKEMENDAS